jgi:hypothetical protein
MSKDTLFRSFWLGATFNLSTSKGSQQLPYHVKRLREFGAIAINQASISHQPPPATAPRSHDINNAVTQHCFTSAREQSSQQPTDDRAPDDRTIASYSSQAL